MTEKELNELYYIKIEINRLRKELEELENKSLVKGQEITGLPGSSGGADKVADHAVELAEIKELIDLKIKQLWLVRSKVERYIETIDDAEMRLIVRLRAVNNMTWEKIGAELGMERTTVSKKYRSFLQLSHNSR